MTDHFLAEGDCRDLGFIEDGSIQLIVTHPPRFGVAAAGSASGQLACAGTYEDYLEQLDEVWEECARVVAPGGMMSASQARSARTTPSCRLPPTSTSGRAPSGCGPSERFAGSSRER